MGGRHATSQRPRATDPRGGSGWELSMVAPRLGTHSRGLPAPGARALSPDRWNGEAHHLRGGAAARQRLPHQTVSSKGSSHLWAALAAGRRTRDFKSGCWLRAALDPWPRRALRPRRTELLSQGHVRPPVRPRTSLTLVPGAVSWVPALRRVPAFLPSLIWPLSESESLARDRRTLFQRRQVWGLHPNIRGAARHLTPERSHPARASATLGA